MDKQTDKKIEKLAKRLEGYECEGQMSLNDPEIMEYFGIETDEKENDEEAER